MNLFVALGGCIVVTSIQINFCRRRCSLLIRLRALTVEPTHRAQSMVLKPVQYAVFVEAVLAWQPFQPICVTVRLKTNRARLTVGFLIVCAPAALEIADSSVA
jgi:hypothetical protein